MASSSAMSFGNGEPESDPELLVEMTNVERSERREALVDGVESVETCPSPRRFVSTDTTIYPGHPNVLVGDEVGGLQIANGSFYDLGSTNVSPLESFTPHIADVDSVDSIANQVRNTKALPLTPSRFICSEQMMADSDEPNNHTVISMIASIRATRGDISSTSVSTSDPRTELDSHANMCVLGRNAYIFEATGRTCNVSPFMDELGIASDVPIVDGAIAYDCPYLG